MAEWKDPEIGAIREMMAGTTGPREATPNWTQRRSRMEAFAGPPPDGVTVKSVVLAGRPAERLTPKGAVPGRVILYLHGGGYCIGSPLSHRALAGSLAEASDAQAVVIDYRLGPEEPFPAAVDDALAAWRALLAEGVDPTRAVVAGDSAGGGLTFALALAAKAADAPLPAALFAISPWTDLTQSGASYESKAASDPIINKDGIGDTAAAYLGGADARSPLASPIFGDLAGLPPVLIQVGGEEMLLTDATGIAEKIALAGGDVTLRVWPEMIHVWHFFAPLLAAGRAATTEAGEWIKMRAA